jgi:subtilase family serine protease
MGALATLVAALTVGSAGASTPDLHRMYVTPELTAAPAAGATSANGNYGLRTCQVGLSTGQCYDPYQMRKAYGVDSLIANGLDGSGKTIVIVDAFDDPNLQYDFSYFNNYYGLPDQTIAQYYPAGQANTPYDAGWSQEMQLDVDWSHAIAPGAKIVIVHGKSSNDDDLVAAVNYAVDHNLGDVISMSFGESDTCLGSSLQSQWHQAFVNATKKGITLFASSGDQGASQPSCDGSSWIKSSSSPASDPLVTGVGGTELHAADYCLPQLGCDPATNPAFGSYLSEIGWNEGPTGDFPDFFDATEASGGGFSTVWSEPAYQQGTIHGGKTRAVPDVAYNAAILHGVLVPLQAETGNPPGGGFYRFGGTSCGAPQWAALTAIADQAAGHDYGFINSALYKIGQSRGSYAAAFHDVTSGSNNAVEFDSANNPVNVAGFNAGPGWDAVTGLGSPKTGGLLSQLAQQWSAGQATAAINNSKNG